MNERSPFEKLLSSIGTVPAATGRMERRLAALLALDVQNYSALMARDEEDTHQRIGQALEAIVPHIKGARGRIISFAGDGLMVEIPSAVEALKCALGIQADAARRNADLEEARRIVFRIGINSGDIVVQRGRIGGDAVNIAARLEQLAEPGGIYISARVREDAHGRLDITAEDIGEQTLKNISRPVRVFRVRPEGAPVPPTTQALPLPDKPSIAVLPFDNMSGDPEQEYFADGVAEDIITELSRSRALFVIARNSSFTYKGRAVDIRKVARELGVRYVLEGSVRRSGNRIRVTAQLIDAETSNHVWAERYDRDLTDVFAVQDEITEAVVGAVHPALADAELQRAMRKPPDNLDAWESYQRGIWHMGKYNPTENEKAITFFHRAIAQDPTFVSAHVLLSSAYVESGQIYALRNLHDAVDLAEVWVRKAASIDPNDAEVLVSLGHVAHLRGDWKEALERASLALSMHPNSPRAHGLKGATMLWNGQPAEGREAILTALRLNPREPNNAGRLNQITISYYLERDYDRAVECARRTIASFPDFPLPYRWLAAALGQLGQTEEAGKALHLAQTVEPKSFDLFVRGRVPWHRPEVHAHMLEGLRKAGWQG